MTTGEDEATGEAAAADGGHEHGPLFLLDGNNIAYRAFFALPESIATTTGFPTNALYGFCSMVVKILSEYAPESVVVAWDARAKTFRHEEFEDYKAQRRPMPDLLQEQWPYFEELSAAFGFVNLKVPGYEADDILATLARQADAEGRPVMIVTGDRDALQLVTEHVRVMATGRGITEVKVYDPELVRERYGIPPRLVADMIGLKGDTSDNIPGVPGIGEKTAAQLLGEFGSLEAVLDNVDRVKGEKRRELLREHRETALLSKRLALAECGVPIDIHAATVAETSVDLPRLRELFLRFEFASLLDRVHALFPGGPEAAKPGRPVQVQAVGPAVLEQALDWTGAVGLASAVEPEHSPAGQGELGAEPGRPHLWLATEDGQGATETIYELLDPGPVAGPLRVLLGRGRPVCHHLKAQPLLYPLVARAAHDTYLAGYLLAPGRRAYDLSELLPEAGLIAAEPTPPGDPRAGEAADVLALAAVQEAMLRRQGMWDLFQQIELPLTPVLIAMEAVGIHLDCERLGDIAERLSLQMAELEDQIYDLAGEEFNLGSPQQLGQILFEKLGLPRGRKTKTGYSTDAKVLESLRTGHEVVDKILTHRELSKLLSTYLLALPAAVDRATSRLHTTFHQAVAATGRLSSSDPNLQNIPVRTELGAQIRECFTAPPGRLLVVADYSQIELRLMAYLSGEATLIEAFRNGEDIHTRTACEVFELPPGEVSAVHRRTAKMVNFGIMYGISAFGLAQRLGIEREVAGEYIKRYFEHLPAVKAFIEATIADARARGYVATVFGRRRPVPEIRSGDYQTRSLGERLAVNSVLQGSAADIIKVAMIRCHQRLGREHPHAPLVLQVHDELLAEAPAEEAEAVRQVMVQEMVAAFPMDPPLVADSGLGSDWLGAK